MDLATCRFVTYSAAMAGEILLFPPYAQTLVGFLYLHRGRLELWSDDKPFALIQEKEASLFSLGRKQQIHVQEDAAWTLCAIECDRPEELIECWTAGQGPVCDCRKLTDADQLLSQINALFFCPEQSHAKKLPIRLFRSTTEQSAFRESDIPAYLQIMRQIIDAQYSQNLTLENLASRVGKSKFHLSRAFQEHYHVTPGEYLNQVRLSHAAQMLAETDLPVQKIGQSVGISNSSYFTARYKRQYGFPPREYRMWIHSAGIK